MHRTSDGLQFTATAAAIGAGVLLAALRVEWAVPAGIMLLAMAVRLRIGPPTLLVGVLAAAAWWYWFDGARARMLASGPRDADVTGVVVGLPYRNPRVTRFDLEIDHAEVFPPGGRLRLRWYDAPEIAPGDRLRLRVRLFAVRGFLGPGTRDARAAALRDGIVARGYVRDRDAAPTRLAAGSRPIDRLRLALRERLVGAVPDASARGILAALALGDGSLLEAADRDRFIATGTVHLVVVSGLHLAIVAGAAWWLVGRVVSGRSRRTVALGVTALCVLAYVQLTGAGLAVQRAAVMTMVALAVVAAGRWQAAWRGAVLGALVVVLLDPLAWTRNGFWLSFGAVAVLLVLGVDRVAASVPRWGRPERAASRGPAAAGERDGGERLDGSPAPWVRLRDLARCARVRSESVRSAPNRLRAGLVLAAPSVLLAPILSLQATGVSPVAPVANLVAIPVVSLVLLPAALVAVAASVPFDPWPAWLWVLPAGGARALSTVLGMFQESGLPEMPPAGPIRAALVVCGLAALWCGRRMLGCLALVPWLACAPGGAPDPGQARITVLDVGQGLSVLVRTRSAAVVYDAGPAWSGGADAGRSVVLPALRAIGTGRARAVVVSHADLDHAGGARSLLGPGPAPPLYVGERIERLPGNVTQTVCEPGRGFRLDRVRFRFLSARVPVTAPGQPVPASGNDLSCVVQVIGEGWSALLPGDIGRAAEAVLVQRGIGPQDVVIAPHHGSRTSSSGAFVAATRPVDVIFAAGADNRFGHPHPEVVDRWRRGGARTWSTGHDGAVRWHSRGRHIETWANRGWWRW